MATEDQFNDKNATPGLSERGKARRRLAKAGVGAGVLLTLESQQAMATSAMCKSPSGSLSGGLSSHYGPAPTCKGLSPGYWKNHPNSWPIPSTTMFASVFYVPGDYMRCDLNSTPTSYLCANMLTLLTHQSYDQNNLAMQTIATYLNILSGRISFLSLEALQTMWREVTTTGVYHPTVGVTWTRAQVARYLDSIHD